MGAKRSRAPEAGDEVEASKGGDLVAQVRTHSVFFDELVELVPPKFYVPKDRSDEWLRYKHSKSEKAQSKLDRKINSKKAKRLKLDPEQALTTSEAIQKKEEASSCDEAEDSENESDFEGSDDEEGAKPAGGAKKQANGNKSNGVVAKVNPKPTWSLSDGSDNASHDELAERLRKRIEAARTSRKAEEHKEQALAAKDWRKKATGKGKDKKRKNKENKAKGDATPPPAKNAKLAAGADVKGQEKDSTLEMSRVDGTGKGKQKKVLSKSNLLKKAEAVQAVVAEGGVKADRHAWSAAMKRASGEKVLDDPKLLKKTLKREEKRKQKSSEKWDKTLQMQKETRDGKQAKAKANLKVRKDSKMDKRQERRDKKLLRPGFEGRKSGFINNESKSPVPKLTSRAAIKEPKAK